MKIIIIALTIILSSCKIDKTCWECSVWDFEQKKVLYIIKLCNPSRQEINRHPKDEEGRDLPMSCVSVPD